jgi:hypothetical protein
MDKWLYKARDLFNEILATDELTDAERIKLFEEFREGLAQSIGDLKERISCST